MRSAPDSRPDHDHSLQTDASETDASEPADDEDASALDRRTFLRRSALGAAGMSAIPASGEAFSVEKRRQEGWRTLFGGEETDLEGWEHVGPGGFDLQDGVLHSRGGMGLLWYTEEQISDAVVRVVYDVANNDVNAGVFIRIPEPPEDPWYAVHNGYEVQIDNGFRFHHSDYHVTGVLYSLTEAMAYPQKQPGEWNTMDITLDGPVTMVHVNGEKVTHYAEGQPVPEERKWFEPERGPRPESGYIGLQNHDDQSEVLIREVSVRPLEG